MFRLILEKVREVARYLRRLREAFAEAQQHMVPALLAAVMASGAARWI